MGTAISCRHADLSYGKQEVLQDITLDIHEGKFVFILGDNGKSSLLKLLGGLEEPRQGTLLHGENNVFRGGDAKRIELLRNTGHLFQEAALIANLSMYENIALPLRYHTRLPEKEIRERVAGMMEELKLHIQTDLRPAVFPIGVRKIAALARALIMEPAMIFLDDPSSGIERSAREAMLRMLLKLKQQGKTTAMFVSEDGRYISQLADRVLILHDGKIIADGTDTEVFASKDPYVREIALRIGQENMANTMQTKPDTRAGGNT
ncbi:MAG: ATP-binding cassette domain-containing protein [Spirochaetota bacterium]|nr:ATP-binding cassette domain-containing protein [Spirochaetota bacterium]